MKTYEEGFSDGLKQAEKNYISVDATIDSIDKFLDKINSLKKLLEEVNVLLVDDYKNKDLKEELIEKISNVLNNNEVKNAKTKGK